jgi:competence protein ComEA
MNKFTALLFGLLMLAFNAFAAVNVNTATPEQLDAIKGIGPAKAKAIVDYRTKNGPFKTVDDVGIVPGIGHGPFLDKIKGELAVSGATTVNAEAKPAAKAEAKSDAKAAAKVEAKPEAKAEAKPESKADAKKAEKEAKAQAKADAKKAEKEAKDAKKAAVPPAAPEKK